jgi:hypothetical protein
MTKTLGKTLGKTLRILTGLLIAAQMISPADQRSDKGLEQPYVVEYYYKARWGFADEFIELFKRNHYPILKKGVESGRMISVSAVKASVSLNRGGTLGLSRDDHLQERGGGSRCRR